MRWILTLCAMLVASAATAQLKPVHPALIAEPPARPDGHLATILSRGELTVGVKTDYEPWGVRRADGRIEGLEIDLAQDLADRLGVRLNVVGVSASNRIDRVNQKRVDVVIATTGDTRERRAQADLIQPNYYSSGVVVYGRTSLDVEDWPDLEGVPICLNRSAYYNRELEELRGINGKYFSGRREALLALNYQRCDGWAFDDTALERYRRDNPSDRFDVLVKPIIEIPWAIIVPKGEGGRSLGRFVSDMVGEWHASGRILERQTHWEIDQTDFIKDLHALWSRNVDGQPVCARDPETGERAAICVDMDPYSSSDDAELTGWAAHLKGSTGIDLGVLTADYDRNRLLKGLGLTLALSGIAIIGALVVGTVFALMEAGLRKWGLLGQVLLLPQRVLVTVARMTPPILQLYIVFFGLGGLFLASPELAPGGFVIACVIFSLYAGASCAVMLTHGLAQERDARPNEAALALLPGAVARSFDGLVAACVNIVKAAGMASTIAVAELVSSVNLTVADGGDATTLMNGLLVFYFLLVTLVLWLLRRARGWVVRA